MGYFLYAKKKSEISLRVAFLEQPMRDSIVCLGNFCTNNSSTKEKNYKFITILEKRRLHELLYRHKIGISLSKIFNPI